MSNLIESQIDDLNTKAIREVIAYELVLEEKVFFHPRVTKGVDETFYTRDLFRGDN